MFPLMIDILVDGIPAQARVTKLKRHKGSYSPVAIDPEAYYGWTELNYDLLDRKGYRAFWLDRLAERKNLWNEIELEIIEQGEEEIESLKQDRLIERKKEMRE